MPAAPRLLLVKFLLLLVLAVRLPLPRLLLPGRGVVYGDRLVPEGEEEVPHVGRRAYFSLLVPFLLIFVKRFGLRLRC